MIGYYLLMFIILNIVTHGKIFAKLFTVVFGLIASIISTLAYGLVLFAMGSDMQYGLQYEVPLIIYTSDLLFVFAFSFLFVAFIKFIKSKINNTLLTFNATYSLCLLFPITHIICAMFILQAAQILDDNAYQAMINENPYSEFIIAFTCIFCMFMDSLLIFVVDYMEKLERKNIETEKQLIKSQMDYQQMMLLKEEKQEFKKIKHDFANILTTAQGFIEIGKPEKAASVLQSTNNDLTGLAGFSICSNETINTIIYIKQQQAKEMDITFIPEIEDDAVLKTDDYDLCRLLHNIIDNALNAVNKLEENRICKIHILINEQEIKISSENRFKIKKSSKKEKSKEHGNGIGIIKEIAKKYDGTYSAWQDNHLYCTETTLKNKKPANSTPPRILA